ncbi:MAG: hypothetical protein PF513_06240 [Tenericutes bacterium]|jgi:hypothetical protein|nr:hypothetical protein [Mycoplasmatota bacterium]
MTYNEKKNITNILSGILIAVVYGIIIYQKYLNGVLDDSNIFRFWAIIILIFIPISIGARIIIMIIFHIFEAVVQASKGNDIEDEMDIVDERDKLIQVKASVISMYIFAFGFVLALITQLFNVSNHVFFIVLVITGLLTDIVSESLMIRYYRRGF